MKSIYQERLRNKSCQAPRKASWDWLTSWFMLASSRVSGGGGGGGCARPQGGSGGGGGGGVASIRPGCSMEGAAGLSNRARRFRFFDPGLHGLQYASLP